MSATRRFVQHGAMARVLPDLEWPLTTERLQLRPAVTDDLDRMLRLRATPGVDEWLSMAGDDEAAFRERYGTPDRLGATLVIERTDDGGVTPIGDLMVSVQDAWAQYEVTDRAAGVQAELGWVLDPDHRGLGLATEAVTAAIELCIGRLGLRRVTAGCFADNEASWRLMERVGMRREVHTVRESLHRSGRSLDGFEYAILADEWRARRRSGPAG